MEHICKNPKCEKSYTTDTSDDGFCSFACWQEVNCGDPKREKEEYDLTPHLAAI